MTRGYTQNAMSAYRSVGVWGGVEAADPQQLITLLLDAAVDGIARARGHLATGDIPAKAADISRVVDILFALRASLNHEAGGEIADRLESLYEYVGRRVTLASASNDAGILAEASSLLGEIRDGWSRLPRQAATPPAPAGAPA